MGALGVYGALRSAYGYRFFYYFYILFNSFFSRFIPHSIFFISGPSRFDFFSLPFIVTCFLHFYAFTRVGAPAVGQVELAKKTSRKRNGLQALGDASLQFDFGAMVLLFSFFIFLQCMLECCGGGN